MERSGYYRNLYDAESGFFRPRMANGEWLPDCSRGQKPEVVSDGYNRYYDCWDKWWIGVSPNRHYTESNAWQYLWYVPHDVAGLIELMGGKESFTERLDEFFTISSSNSGSFYEGVTGVIGQYVHGNEPSHHVPYLYNYSGAPWKTQERVRKIMEYKYGIDYRGILGNDDMGQMSAWFVFSALGFYPVTPGDSKYQIGSPLFERAVVDLSDYYGNRTFTVIARNNSGDNLLNLRKELFIADQRTLLKYLDFLEKAEVISTLTQKVKGNKIMHKPDKIYLGNTNYLYGLNMGGEETGTVRETFFESQLSVDHILRLPKDGDFVVDEKYTFEVGGKNKSIRQIKDLTSAYLALDDIENGIFNQIPLWLFGFLY